MSDVVQKRQRNHLFDLLKTICIIFVVISHVNWDAEKSQHFLFPYIIDMAVPVFLIISAYLRSKKMQVTGIKEYISFKSLFKTFVFIMISYVITAFAEIFLAKYFLSKGITVWAPYLESSSNLYNWFITGLQGPGSYYVPILVQLIFYFPCVFLLFKKNKNIGLICSFIINLFYEIMVVKMGMEVSLYRLLIFRYTLMLGFGIYLSYTTQESKDDVFARLMILLGLAYITKNHFISPSPLFLTWKSTCMLTAPYAYGFMYFMMKYCSNVKTHKRFIFGKASYNIFLTQMVYFNFGLNGYYFTKLVSIFSENAIFIDCIISTIICFAIGVVFYKIDLWIKKTVIKY